MKGRLNVSGTARFVVTNPRNWWLAVGRAMLDHRIKEAEGELIRAEKQYKFALENLDTLYKLRKEGKKRYGTRERAVQARKNGKHRQRHQQRQAEANRSQG